MSTDLNGVAIIGMSGRFPGAANLAEFWEMLASGRSGISTFSDEELSASGVTKEQMAMKDFVRNTAIVSDVDKFDAAFFNFSPAEAQKLDPQQRLFLESAWGAMEDAGYDPLGSNRSVGVFAGCSLNTYLLQNLLPHFGAELSLAGLQMGLSSDKDFLSTRVSYKLNLQGPSLTVQTACSTSLVAVHLAVQSILLGECDCALAGGSSIRPNTRGYLYEEGSILSPEGQCRPFDHKALGTVPGNGVGVVFLKRLEDAVRDRDPIYAVLKGTAINNDGAVKIGYTAPNPEGQARVITEALAVSGVDPATISFIETHGTGTPLGDPIEVEALALAHGEEAKGTPCALGALKSSVGHMDAAAGVGGLMKAALSLHHGKIPPSPYFEQANPKVGLENTRFYVSPSLVDWNSEAGPRRAGVSSFGMGGTNAHAVLEEAPERKSDVSRKKQHVVALSAQSAAALDRITKDLAAHLAANPYLSLADVAYTLQVGRHGWKHRRVVAGETVADIAAALQQKDPTRVFTHEQCDGSSPVFLFPGQGSQHPGMAKRLYEEEPVFREGLDRCAEILKPLLGLDLRTTLFPKDDADGSASALLAKTWITQPALFSVEYSLAQLWMSWGVEPAAMLGHSVGEYVAACLAGVFSLEDGLRLIAERGSLIFALPAGTMLSVNLAADKLPAYALEKLSLAAVNAPGRSVLSGETADIEFVQGQLTQSGIECRVLKTSHAFHSAMMEPALEPFRKTVANVKLNAPKIPFVSNVTGTWITDEQATSPDYWASHIRSAVRFADGVTTLVQSGQRLFLEVGPGRTLGTFVKAITDALCLNTLPHPQETASDSQCATGALGRFWAAGGAVKLENRYGEEARLRLHLPTYSFEKKRHWIERADIMMVPKVVEAAPVEAEAAPEEGACPLSEMEQLVADYWKTALGTTTVGVRDNFFELGGDSMIATQIVNRLKRELSLSIPVSLLLQSETVAKFATALEDKLLEEMARVQALN